MQATMLLSAVFVFNFSLTAVAQDIPRKDVRFAYDFGKILPGQSLTSHWNLRAKDQDLNIQSISIMGEGYSLQSDCPAVLPALQKCTLTVTFAPTKVQNFKGLLTVDLYTEKFLIDFNGDGI